MPPSTGHSGDSQPAHRRRRRRRGSGNSTGRNGHAGRNPAQGDDSTRGTADSDRTRRAAAAESTGALTPGNDMTVPADQQGRPGRRPRRRRRAAHRSGQKTDTATGTNAARSDSARSDSKTAKSGKSGAKFGKAGGRRLRTVDETSAGGLVVDPDRVSAALIGRLDRRGRLLWSLPKGHIESGETPEQAAIREVAEETGIAGRVLAPLGTIDYWFVAEDRRVHKTVHHFLMEAVGGELSDEDMEVTEVAWVPLGELDGRLAYADERRLVRLATELLSESA
jgi:8-oxo-dGTP pyrophosphatase MutT (NUDIX family)